MKIAFRSCLPVAVATSFLFVACATVPKDAPKQFHQANYEIKKAKAEDVDDYMPKTIDKAENTLDDAVTLYKEGKDKDDVTKIDNATESAQQAKDIAATGRAIVSDIKSWDSDNNKYLALKAKPRRVVETAEVRETELTLSAPIAYFSTASADLEEQTRVVDELAKTLKSNPDLEITLIGFADYRGSEEFNAELSKKRAEAVAAVLKEEGVEEGRIMVEHRGEQGATVDTKSPGTLQMERRVEAKIQSVAH